MNKLLEKLKGKKWIEYLFLGVLSIILIIVFLSAIGKEEKKDIVSTIDGYVTNLEYRLSTALSQVDGAGSVTVVITVESGMETVLATEKTVTENPDKSVTTSETPIIINGKTVVLMEKYPKIVGVLIVAQGADNFAIMNKLQQATVSLLDIDISKVEILSKK